MFEIAATGHLPATPPVDPPDDGTGTPVPVPGTEALLLVGLASLGVLRRRTRGLSAA
jgi:MYXO-CTERM domain-containing protein